jgi:hypothetical protein
LIEHDSRLRVGRAIGKTEEEVAEKLMVVQKRRGNPDKPPSLTSDAAKGYESALINVYGIQIKIQSINLKNIDAYMCQCF